jgi:hypothetical protein
MRDQGTTADIRRSSARLRAAAERESRALGKAFHRACEPHEELDSWLWALRIFGLLLVGIILISAATALSGCAAVETKTDVRTVTATVAVATPCDAPQIDKPVAVWPTDAENADAGVDKAMLAALQEINLREAYEIRLRAAVDGCRKQEPPAPQK